MTKAEMRDHLLVIRGWHTGNGMSIGRLDSVIDALAEPDSPADTIRVKVAVIADIYGNIGAWPCDKSCDAKRAMETAYDGVPEGPDTFVAQAFIEAWIPKIPTIQGQIVELPDAK